MNEFFYKKIFYAGLGAICLLWFPALVRAAGLVVTPAVIDDHGLPRDILNYTLTAKNTDDHLANVFVSVYNLTADGKQAFEDPSLVDSSLAEKSVSLANWISVSRGAMPLAPGETKTIPVSININPYAAAGTYHAVIAFVEGSTRDEAETHLDGAPQALVDLTVQSNVKEELALASFAPTGRVVSAFPVSFAYAIENTGDVASTPSGLVLFYDRLGREIGSVDANPEHVAIAPGETHNFTAQWGSGQGFGQYKAMLDLTYGAAGNKLQNVALVWVLPWQKLTVVFVGLLAAVIVLAAWIHRQYEKRHHRRMSILNRILAHRHVIDLRHPYDIHGRM
ncbi:MAG: hypothetical protein ABSE18_03560 [Minisyncoccia bacterium]|jgi:hypothetical protein